MAHIGHIKDFILMTRSGWCATSWWTPAPGFPGGWFSFRPLALGGFDESEKVLRVALTRRQIENSPPIAEHKPVSRQYEEEYFQYYNWPYYWQGGALWGLSDFPAIAPLPVEAPDGEAKAPPEDAHLDSAKSIFGYKAQGVDKEAGSVADVLIEDRNWTVHGIVVDSGHWNAARKNRRPGRADRADQLDGFFRLFEDHARGAGSRHPLRSDGVRRENSCRRARGQRK